jgi:hypothetical protein
MAGAKQKLDGLPPDHAAMVCRHVFDRSRDVLALAIDQDRRVTLDCGDEEHGEKDWHMAGLGSLTASDATLLNAPAIAPQEYCERSFRGGPWWIAAFED